MVDLARPSRDVCHVWQNRNRQKTLLLSALLRPPSSPSHSSSSPDPDPDPDPDAFAAAPSNDHPFHCAGTSRHPAPAMPFSRYLQSNERDGQNIHEDDPDHHCFSSVVHFQLPNLIFSAPAVPPGGGAEALPAGLYPSSSSLSWFSASDGYSSPLSVPDSLLSLSPTHRFFIPTACHPLPFTNLPQARPPPPRPTPPPPPPSPSQTHLPLIMVCLPITANLTQILLSLPNFLSLSHPLSVFPSTPPRASTSFPSSPA